MSAAPALDDFIVSLSPAQSESEKAVHFRADVPEFENLDPCPFWL